MFTRKRGAALAVFTVTAALALSACGSDDGDGDGDAEAQGLEACQDDPVNCNSGEAAEGGELTILVNQGHDGVFNPETSQGNSIYMRQMLQGLGINGAELSIYLPDGELAWNLDVLAAEPEVVTEDPLTVRYQIREEAVWSDGEPINIDDVEFLQKHNSGKEEDCSDCSPADPSFFDTTVSIDAEDDGGKTFTITYEDGWTHPEWFARALYSLPAHVADEQGFDWRDDPDDMAAASAYFSETVPTWSAGPYVVESWTADETQVMVPNENWFGETQPTLDTIVKEIVSDPPSWVPATENEELNAGAPASFTVDLQQQLSQIPGVYTGVNSDTYSWDHVDVNMDSITDQALRQAIFTAIDIEDARERIWGALDELPSLRTGLFIPQFNEFHEDVLTETGYGTGDVAAARTILEDAGYTGFEAGEELTDPDGEPVPQLDFAFLAGNENRDTFTQLTQSYLAEIGLNVEPASTPPDDLGTVLSEQDYDLVIFGWSGDPTITNGPFQFYNTASPSNFGKLDNPDIDSLTEEARNQSTLAETAEIHYQTARAVLEEAYVLPLWDTPDLMWVSDQYTNMRDNSAWQGRAFYNIGEWGAAAAE